MNITNYKTEWRNDAHAHDLLRVIPSISPAILPLPIADGKYELIQDFSYQVDIDNCHKIPCEQRTNTLFKKGDVVMGYLKPVISTPNSKPIPMAHIWFENNPRSSQYTIPAGYIKLISKMPLLKEPEITTLQNKVASSSVGNIVTSTTGKVVGGILLVALILGLLKWKKVI